MGIIFDDLEVTSNPSFNVTVYLISQKRCILGTKLLKTLIETIPSLSNGATFNDPE